MKADHIALLQLLRLPGVLTLEQAAALTGFSDEEVAVLARARILPPLGNPQQNEKRLFAAVVVEKFNQDPVELERARVAIRKHWQRKNQSRAGLSTTQARESKVLAFNGAKTSNASR